jgi:hypothetical protein
MGRDVATAWNGALTERLAGADTFTRILPADAVERGMRLSDLGRTTREGAIRLGEKAGADRVVWGSIGAIDAQSGVQVFDRNVWRRTRDGWVEVPLHVIARTRTVTADLAYEVIATKSGTTLARESGPRTLQARAVWTAVVPEGGSDGYALVTDEFRAANPERTRQIEGEWATVVGAGTTLAQVLDARRAAARRAPDRTEVLARYAAGAAFVLLEELPGKDELAQAALASAWPSVQRTLLTLDAVDDVDLGAFSSTE